MMKVAIRLSALAGLTIGHALAQKVSMHVPVSTGCIELNDRVVTQVTNGQYTLAESLLSTATISRTDATRDSCAGLVLKNVASLFSVSGRIAEAERYAERSVKILEAIYPPSDLVLLAPLFTLASTRFEQGKTAGAREAFKKMQSIRTERPADRVLVHDMAAVLLEAERRFPEAEAEYLITFHALEEAGLGEAAEAGAVLNSLGSIYIEEQRLEEARSALDRALIILSNAKDTVSLQRIKLFNLKGVLLARQGAWLEAEQDLSAALAMADQEPWLNPIALRTLLTIYAYALRRNHHRREARSIEARAAGIHTAPATSSVIDVTDLLTERKQAKK